MDDVAVTALLADARAGVRPFSPPSPGGPAVPRPQFVTIRRETGRGAACPGIVTNPGQGLGPPARYSRGRSAAAAGRDPSVMIAATAMRRSRATPRTTRPGSRRSPEAS